MHSLMLFSFLIIFVNIGINLDVSHYMFVVYTEDC